MEKYTAIIKNTRLISVFADSKADAERVIGIHLRGRPGCDHLYEGWVKAGKEMIAPETETIRIEPA